MDRFTYFRVPGHILSWGGIAMEDGLGRRGNSMFYGAMLLTAGSLGLRLVQMAFQVYISGVMGAAGLGRMQLIMTVGGFAGFSPPAGCGLR